MLARVRSGALVGVDAVVVEVEVDMTLGLPFFNVVGLPEGAAKESKVRVVSAIKNAGFVLPQKRVTVNLAPADLRKDGATFELPIALGVLAAAGQLDQPALDLWLFGGELSLDGAVKPIRGVLPLAMAARDGGFRGVLVPHANAPEAALVDRIDVIPVGSLFEAVQHLTGDAPLLPYDRAQSVPGASATQAMDLAEVRGQSDVKDALELAAAGGHNMLTFGPIAGCPLQAPDSGLTQRQAGAERLGRALRRLVVVRGRYSGSEESRAELAEALAELGAAEAAAEQLTRGVCAREGPPTLGGCQPFAVGSDP